MGTGSASSTSRSGREPEPERDRARRGTSASSTSTCSSSVDPASLVLPIGCPTAFPKPQPGWCSTPAPIGGDGHVGARGAVVRGGRPARCSSRGRVRVVNSIETVRAMQEEVPGLRLLVDTGHVADWGGDPLELLEHADHVQLRQGSPGDDAGARRRPARRRRLRRGAAPPRRARLPGLHLGRVLRPPRARLGPRRPDRLGRRPPHPPPERRTARTRSRRAALGGCRP